MVALRSDQGWPCYWRLGSSYAETWRVDLMGYIIVKNVLSNPSWLENIRLDNVRLFVSHDPSAPYENTRTAIVLRQARSFSRKDSQIRWGQPQSETWRSGLTAEDVEDLRFDTLDVEAAPASTAPVIEITNANKVTLQAPRAETTHLAGSGTREVRCKKRAKGSVPTVIAGRPISTTIVQIVPVLSPNETKTGERGETQANT